MLHLIELLGRQRALHGPKLPVAMQHAWNKTATQRALHGPKLLTVMQHALAQGIAQGLSQTAVQRALYGLEQSAAI
eukprot:1160206-Pelagomonas_calceolata.AAC.5